MREEEFARDKPAEYALIGEAKQKRKFIYAHREKTIAVNASLERDLGIMWIEKRRRQ
jgi:hypothetical protein